MLFAHLVTQVEVSPCKRVLLHLPTPFPPLSSLCQDQTLLLREPVNFHCWDMVVGKGGRGEDLGWGRIVVSYQNSRKQH